MHSARDVIEQHFDAINAQDASAYIATLAFPFTYQNYNGVALTISTAGECGTESAPYPWDIILRTDSDWSHSEFTSVELLAETAHSAAYKVSFVRVDKSGVRSAIYDAIWIAVRQVNTDEWLLMYRHNMGERSEAG